MKLQIHRDIYVPDYEGETKRCSDFVTTFSDPSIPKDQFDPIHGNLKYMTMLQAVVNKQRNLITIEMDDLHEFFNANKDQGFIDRVKRNTQRYIKLFSSVIDSNLPLPSLQISDENLTTFDIVMQQRRFNNQQARAMMINQGYIRNDEQQNRANQIDNYGIPPELERQYSLVIVPEGQNRQGNGKRHYYQMREIKSELIGSLINVKGIVTRCSDVKPCMQVAVYACDACGMEVYQIINQKAFTPKVECPGMRCKKNQIKGQLILQVKQSKFISYQDIKIQEPSDQVPVGHVPRQIDIVAKGHTTRKCSPGDVINVVGIYMISMQTGWSATRRDRMFHQAFIDAFDIEKDKINFREFMLSEEMIRKVDETKHSMAEEELFKKMAQSICPEIFGMEQVKEALLLLMIGGETKEMRDGMKIRGQINFLLMGDPGVAKSQFLKHISSFAPRAIYTNGKGSSGAGLTAAVMKDPTTGEVVLEGGALVLADNGICCIDEFDKMDDRDRTNIHEVMEQQTISIAKSGITTSLNARTSILAAANPVYGRYNKKLSPHQNINLSAALLSRFDLIFLLLDKADTEFDKKLAQHVTKVHQTLFAPTMNDDKIDSEIMRSFIAKAQTYTPVIPYELHQYIVARYVEKRKFQREGKEEVSYMYITPRTLLAIIRISQAMAKFHFRSTVTQPDVDHAIKLMDFSFQTLEKMDQEEQKSQRRDQQDDRFGYNDKTTRIINDIRDIMKKQQVKQMNQAMIINQLQKMHPTRYTARGFTKDNILDTLAHYKKLQVVYIDTENNVVFL